MQDYRKKLEKLLKATDNSQTSLYQTAVALDLITDLLLTNSPEQTPKKQVSVKPITVSVPDKSISKDTLDQYKTNPPTHVGAILKQLLKDNNITQVALSKATGIAQSKISMLVNQKTTLSDTQAQMLNNTFGLTSEEWLKLNNYYLKNKQEPVPNNNKTPELIEFKQAVVEEIDNKLVIVKNVLEHAIADQNNSIKNAYVLPKALIKQHSLHQGSCVDLVWREDEPTDILITHVYPQTIKITHQKKNSKTRYKLDFNGASVAVISADKALFSNVKGIIEHYNGKSVYLSSENSATIMRRCSNIDYVIAFKNYINHEISKTLFKSGKNIALVNNAGRLQFERALYRSFNRLNVLDNDDVKYELA